MDTEYSGLSEEEFKRLQGHYQAKYGISMNKQVLLLFETLREASQEQIKHLEKKQEEHTKMLQENFEQLFKQNQDVHQQQIEVLNDRNYADKKQHEDYITAIENTNKVIENTTKVIESKKGQIVTDNPWVTFSGNFSKYGFLFLTFALPITFAIYCINSYFVKTTEYEKISKTLKDYPNVYKYESVCQNGTSVVNPTKGKFVGEFLALTIPKENEKMKVGVHYYLDETNNRILVPLSLDRNPIYANSP